MPTRASAKPNKADIELLIGLLKLVSLVSRPMRDSVADAAGLSANELRILMALSGEGEAAGHDLAEMMGMNPMNVSRALASLDEMGLAEPATNVDNRRRKPYRLSRKGRRRYETLKPRIADVAEALFATLSKRERDNLARTLAKLERQVLDWQPDEALAHVKRA